MFLPSYVQKALDRFSQGGFSAYCVGGCVRDSLRGVSPHDYDLASSALPEQAAALFSDCTVIPTGVAHGTLTILLEGHPLEVTTCRTDGDYSDRRRPDSVQFCATIQEDLARRDFTVNAMAYHPAQGLLDPFGGREDLNRSLIRCVGDPVQRFSEDALRILRALRFASELEFSIHSKTAAAALDLSSSLTAVAKERCTQELSRLLCGPGVSCVLQRFYPVVAQLFPPSFRFLLPEDFSPLGLVPPCLPQRLAMLLRRFSPQQAEDLLRDWKLDNRTRKHTLQILSDAALPPPDSLVQARKRLNRESLSEALQALEHQAALWPPQEDPAPLARARKRLEQAAPLCCRLEQLAITGRQLRPIGVPPGREMGNMLRSLLEEVMDGRLKNERDALLDRARVLWEGKKFLP